MTRLLIGLIAILQTNARCILLVVDASVLGRFELSMKYEIEIAASSLMKSRSRVELKSTGSDLVVLSLATSGELV